MVIWLPRSLNVIAQCYRSMLSLNVIAQYYGAIALQSDDSPSRRPSS
ncbi:MAG: hypothetical protein HC936_14380 [Leptolyngbyaceae cyanobacterium SU_3_3]|nr:hypothetical protein [Leptolyngbyaceae cyanobacterium SU_3_3]